MSDETLKIAALILTAVLFIIVYIHVICFWTMSDFLKTGKRTKMQAYWAAVAFTYKGVGFILLGMAAATLTVFIVTKLTWLQDGLFDLLKWAAT